MDLRIRPRPVDGYTFLATWNIRSLYKPEARRILEQELMEYDIDVADIQVKGY